MKGAQFQFMPFMLQDAEYNCSEVMPPGPAWAEQYGVRQTPFGIYSFVFGIVTEILYIPCAIGLHKDKKTSCFKIMFWLSIIDVIALMANSVLFGILIMQGAIYCSNPVLTLGVGIVGYWVWLTASACCFVLGINRLFEMTNKSAYFSSNRTNIYLGICFAYGIFMVLFTRPAIVNSTYQSIIFAPLIPGHGLDEYANWPHAVHNMSVAFSSCLLYITLSIVIMIKSRHLIAAEGSRSRVVTNIPVFVQVMLICGMNAVGTSIYVYMNFFPATPALIVTGHVAWQLIHGSPPFIYLALNRSIREFALHSIGLGSMLRDRVTTISNSQGTTHTRGTR